MKTRIYLFCNLGYGSAFLRAVQSVAQELHGYEFWLVLSARSRHTSLSGRIARLLRRPIRAWRHFRCMASGGDRSHATIDVPDVNDSTFLESIPQGSIGFIAGFNQIFKNPAIARFSTFLNFHPSLLPYYRGAIPSYWVLKNGETTTGLTVHTVSEKIDAGEILYQETVAINRYMTESELDEKIAAIGACYLKECLRAIATQTPFRRCHVEPTYSVKVDYVPSKRI